MDRDRDSIRGLYDTLISENTKQPMTVGKVTPGELEGETKSTQKGTGAENAKNVKAPEEADAKLSPVNKDKGTNVTAKQKKVTTIKDSVEPRKSFMDLFDDVMVREEDGDIESAAYNDEEGDFPEVEDEIPAGDEGGEMSEGEIYSQLADLFSQLASMKGAEMGGMDDMGDEMGGEDLGGEEDMEGGMPPPRSESVQRRGRPIAEMKSEPEPKEFSGNVKERQLPTKLAGKGVTVSPNKKAAVKGNDKRRTGELEAGPAGMKHDKSKYRVEGDGPIHKGANASYMES